jgi:hypothetical protein
VDAVHGDLLGILPFANPRLRKRPAAVSLVNREAAVSHLTDTAAVGLPTASRQRIGSADSSSLLIASAASAFPWRPGSQVMTQCKLGRSAMGATARFRGVAAKVLHYLTWIWRRLTVLTSCPNIALEAGGTGYVESLVRSTGRGCGR